MNFARMTKGESGSRLENISGDIRMKKRSVFILKGNIVYSKNQKEFSICENGYVVCKDGLVEGVYKTLPFKLGGNPIRDYGDALIVPGFADLHVHAPQ